MWRSHVSLLRTTFCLSNFHDPEDIVTDLGEEMPIRDFVKEYMAVRADSFAEKTIRMAWKKSGAWPIDKAVFSDGDYAPSVPFSTTATHLPKDFDATASFPPVVAPSWACDHVPQIWISKNWIHPVIGVAHHVNTTTGFGISNLGSIICRDTILLS
jgi:hypothetical protein